MRTQISNDEDRNLKQAFIKADETDTVLIMKTLNATHRVWNNKAAQTVLELESKKDTQQGQIFSVVAGIKAKKMYTKGDLDAGGFCFHALNDLRNFFRAQRGWIIAHANESGHTRCIAYDIP